MNKFEVISVSASNLSYKGKVNDEEYFGVLPGLMSGWQFEFVKNGEIGYNSVYYSYETPEHCAEYEHWNFDTESMFGYEPTGRVVFRGYAAEGEWIPEEREYSVREATKWEIQAAIEEKLAEEGVTALSEPYEYEEYEELEQKWA